MLRSALLRGVEVNFMYCAPKHWYLGVPKIPQNINTIMQNFPQNIPWEAAFNIMYHTSRFSNIGEGNPIGILYEGGILYPSYEDHPINWPIFLTTRHKADIVDRNNAITATVRNAVQIGPRLVRMGEALTRTQLLAQIQILRYDGLRVDDRTNRRAIGITAQGLICEAIVWGTTLDDMAQIMVDLKCVDALGGDGGSSAVFRQRNGMQRGNGNARLACTSVVTNSLPFNPFEGQGGDNLRLPEVNYRLTRNFTLVEGRMRCPHCETVRINDGYTELIGRLQLLRERINRPIIITSGYRCPEYNRRVNGATNSQHMLGTAADIRVDGMTPRQLADHARTAGFRGIGIYSNSLHVDVRQTPATWEG